MRRITILLLAAVLPLASLAFAPAPEGGDSDSQSATNVIAGEPGATVAPDPIEVTYHLHGEGTVPYIDENAYLDGGILPMDRTGPEGDFESRQLTNYAQGPNARCAGNGLWPVWTGYFGRGVVVGEATLAFDVVASTPGPVTVDVFTDVTGQACNEAYPEPAASTTVTLPVGIGRVEAVLDLDGVTAGAFLMIQLRPGDSANPLPNPVPNPGAPIWPAAVAPLDPTAQARVLYDGTDYDATLTFTCQPDDITFDDDGSPSHEPTCLPF